MTITNCRECGYAVVPQSQYKVARTEGRDVRAHEGRGLCTPCYTQARIHGRRATVPQVRSGELDLRRYGQRDRSQPTPLVTTSEQRAAALTCAEHVPAADLQNVLELLGLTGAA